MYYVIKGTSTYFVARGPGSLANALENFETMNIHCYDYDDTVAWIDDALECEWRRVKDDPYAKKALDAEKDRRTIKDKNCHAPWFDDAAAMAADFSMALEEEQQSLSSSDEDDDFWDENDLTPIVKNTDLTVHDLKMIHEVAEFARSGKKSVGRYEDPPELMILKSDFCQTALRRQDAYLMRYYNEVDVVEDLKDLAARLLFIYGEERGRKGAGDFFDAAMYLYHAAVEMQEQIDEEDFSSDDEDLDENPENENPLEIMAHLFSEHIRNVDADDQFVAELGKETDGFMTEKGFDLSSLAGLKAAQKWLENARAEEVLWPEGPVDNVVDRHLGEARLAAMLKVVKARIEQRLKR